jgi:hypothetical protein
LACHSSDKIKIKVAVSALLALSLCTIWKIEEDFGIAGSHDLINTLTYFFLEREL